MNIMEYLEEELGSYVAYREDPGVREMIFSNMEIRIREGIAQEIEDLVGDRKPVKNWGVPNSAAAFAQSTAITPSNPAIQQEYFRGAANCVRGKHLATDDDWNDQAEAMKNRTLDSFAEDFIKLPEYSMSGLSKADVRNIVHAHETGLALKAERREERLREWND